MIFTKLIGNLTEPAYKNLTDSQIDYLCLDYTDSQKHLLRAMTVGGRDIAIRLEPAAQAKGLANGDILGEADGVFIVIKLLPTASLVVKPRDVMEAVHFCYEIGNRHAPLYSFDKTATTFAVLYDAALEDLLKKLAVEYSRQDLVLEERSRLKLHTNHHHHHHTDEKVAAHG